MMIMISVKKRHDLVFKYCTCNYLEKEKLCSCRFLMLCISLYVVVATVLSSLVREKKHTHPI